MTVLCKEFAEKRSVAYSLTDLSKVFSCWERKYVFSLHFAEHVFFDYRDADIEVLRKRKRWASFSSPLDVLFHIV